MKTIEDEVKSKVKKFQDMEAKLLLLQNSLSKNKEFQQFIKLQKTVNDKANEVWTEVEQLMIDNDKDKIDADWVLLTIVKSKKLIINEDKIALEFTKEVPNVKEINKYIAEHKKPPYGVEQVPNPYLRKSFRQLVS